MKILIVDDEQLARERLISLLQEFDVKDSQIRQAKNGAEAVQQFIQQPVGIVLMDIRMPVMDGLEAAQNLMKMNEPPAVIFTTAYDEHALAAFERNAIDYLLKPVRKERLQAALKKAVIWSQAQQQAVTEANDNGARTHLCAHYRGGIQLIPVEKVIYFQADNKYITTRHSEGEILLEESLKHLETEFSERFIRIHRNALVAAREVVGIEKHADGHSFIRLKSTSDEADQLEISRRHLPAIRKWLKTGTLPE